MWNPTLGLFCHVQVGVIMESESDEVVLERIALSCHFALDSECEKAELHNGGIITILEYWLGHHV